MYFYKVALLNQTVFTYSCQEKLSEGTLVTVPLKSTVKEGVVLEQTEQPVKYEAKSILEIKPLFFTQTQLEIARFIARYYFCDLAVALNIFTPLHREYTPFTLQSPIEKPTLSPDQQSAFETLKTNRTSLLFGVTGSGKTEVYISYIYEILQKNQTVLLLMPEISLTPQIQKRLERYFGKTVGLWHSKLTKKQRTTLLQRLYDGEIGIVIGARSALFLPLQNPGLIIVDEEHDDSYKAANKPRYHAKDIALLYANRLDIPIVLGSATPSLGSYVKFPVVRLPKPFVQTNKEYRFISGDEFDHYLQETIKQNAQKQSLIFIPTRANFKYLHCKSCGDFVKCPFCSVGMSMHSGKKMLKCHYCSFTQAIPQTCPSCHDVTLSSQRMGTAEIMNILKDTEGLRLQQFDTDTITTGAKLKKALAAFEKGETNVLVGTQMLSKGHDYPNITLSVIMGLDYLLSMADFRAREKALSLFTQIAGRSGRKEHATVITQTANAEFFQSYLNDYEKFLREEIPFRKELYPPFTTLAKLLFSHKNQNKVTAQMQAVEQKLHEHGLVEVVGAGPNAIERIAGKFRYNILLRSEKKTQMLKAISAVYDGSFEVDMDCIHFD